MRIEIVDDRNRSAVSSPMKARPSAFAALPHSLRYGEGRPENFALHRFDGGHVWNGETAIPLLAKVLKER